jgi:hypothetical protein
MIFDCRSSINFLGFKLRKQNRKNNLAARPSLSRGPATNGPHVLLGLGLAQQLEPSSSP